MNHLKAIILKFIATSVILLVVLTLLYDVSIANMLSISIVITLVTYVLGDLVIFRKAGDRNQQNKRNAIATVSDIIVSFLIIWLMGEAMFEPASDIYIASAIAAIVIGISEWVFHKYIDKNVFPRDQHRTSETATH